MESKVIMPSESLRPYVNHYWIMRASGNSMDMNIMPMGSMKWIFHRGTPLTINGLVDESNVASICGQYTSAAHVRMHGQTNLIFVFFRPYAMRMITGIPCQLFKNDNVPMASLERPEFKILKEMVLNAPDDDSAIAIIEDSAVADTYPSIALTELVRMSEHRRIVVGSLRGIGDSTIERLIRTIHLGRAEHTGIVRNIQAIVSQEEIIITIVVNNLWSLGTLPTTTIGTSENQLAVWCNLSSCTV